MRRKDITVGSMYRVVCLAGLGFNRAYVLAADGAIVVVTDVPIGRVTVFVKLLFGEITSSFWHSGEAFPMHPRHLEELE